MSSICVQCVLMSRAIKNRILLDGVYNKSQVFVSLKYKCQTESYIQFQQTVNEFNNDCASIRL